MVQERFELGTEFVRVDEATGVMSERERDL